MLGLRLKTDCGYYGSRLLLCLIPSHIRLTSSSDSDSIHFA